MPPCPLPWVEVVVAVAGWQQRLCSAHSAEVVDLLTVDGCNEVSAVYGVSGPPWRVAQSMIIDGMAAEASADR